MNDRVESLWCSNCGKACEAKMWTNDHLGSACCEGYLLRRLTDDEMQDIIADLTDDADFTPAQRARLRVLDGV